MPETRSRLTPGAEEALKRLKRGDKLEQEVNRSLIRWTRGKQESIHHLTFKNLVVCGAVKKVNGRSGFTTYGISEAGKKLVG